MPLIDQLFTQIVSNPPVINPGAGGWDAILNQFLADRRGRHGFGLLGRVIEITDIPTSGTGTILVNVPPGWRCCPLFVLVFASQNPAGDMQFTLHSDVTGERLWADIILNGAAGELTWDQMPFLIWPKPGGGDIFGQTTAEQIPVLDGDDVDSSNTFRVNRDSAANITYSFFVYGMAWPTSD